MEMIPKWRRPTMRGRSKYAPGPLELIEATDPVRRSVLSGLDIDDALDDIGVAITGRGRTPQPVPRRWPIASRRTALVLAVALVALTAGVATGAGVFSAHTGIFPSPTDQAAGGPGEALDPAAPDFRAVA